MGEEQTDLSTEENTEDQEDNTEEESTEDEIKPQKAPKDLSPLQQAREIEKQLTAKLKKYEDLILRQEELLANEVVRGRSMANVKTEKKEVTPQEYKDMIMRGELDVKK